MGVCCSSNEYELTSIKKLPQITDEHIDIMIEIKNILLEKSENGIIDASGHKNTNAQEMFDDYYMNMKKYVRGRSKSIGHQLEHFSQILNCMIDFKNKETKETIIKSHKNIKLTPNECNNLIDNFIMSLMKVLDTDKNDVRIFTCLIMLLHIARILCPKYEAIKIITKYGKINVRYNISQSRSMHSINHKPRHTRVPSRSKSLSSNRNQLNRLSLAVIHNNIDPIKE